MLTSVDLDPRWSEVFQLFSTQHIRHVDIRDNVLKLFRLLKDQPLHYLGESLDNALIVKAPQWSYNQGEYRDALMWEDIIYMKEEKLLVSNKGSAVADFYSLGMFDISIHSIANGAIRGYLR